MHFLKRYSSFWIVKSLWNILANFLKFFSVHWITTFWGWIIITHYIDWKWSFKNESWLTSRLTHVIWSAHTFIKGGIIIFHRLFPIFIKVQVFHHSLTWSTEESFYWPKFHWLLMMILPHMQKLDFMHLSSSKSILCNINCDHDMIDVIGNSLKWSLWYPINSWFEDISNVC